MVFWERRVGLLLVLAAVGVGVYGAVSVPGWPWSFPVACALAFVGSVGLTSPRPSSRLLAQYERWRAPRPRVKVSTGVEYVDPVLFPAWRCVADAAFRSGGVAALRRTPGVQSVVVVPAPDFDEIEFDWPDRDDDGVLVSSTADFQREFGSVLSV